MKNMKFPNAFGIAAISFSCLLAACLPTSYPGFDGPQVSGHGQHEQSILSKLTHWRQLASQTAESIRGCLNAEGEKSRNSKCGVKSDHAVYLANTDMTSPFGRAFHDLLSTELLERGIRLSDKPGNAVIVRTNTRLVERDGILPAGDFPGPVTALSGGLVLTNFAIPGLVALGGAADYLQFRKDYTQGSQLLVTTSLHLDGILLRQFAQSFYIPSTDRVQYASGLPHPAPSISRKSATTPSVAVFKIVND
ncbi:MAG: hypothetical protein HOK54_02690 [Alphaproteobacteria bacterium]|jgi:hypothetical protein|nr:hypothetical protein [Alphaproteobacteria bacterium]